MDNKILVFNNSTGIAETMRSLFIEEQIRMLVASEIEELIRILTREEIQLLLVDIALDDSGWDNGIETIHYIRKKTQIPVIVISSQTAEIAKIMALNAGADDYVTVSCTPLELLARAKTQMRRYTQLINMCAEFHKIYKVDGLEINDESRTVHVDGREVRLTPIEYKILRLLVKERGKVLSISQIYESIWHMQAIGADNTIAVHIRHIREKIENDPKEPRYLKVVWGNGYKVG
ncbi:MAG: response regulator transcription factor [Lachnospiraceae bacterium]|nr:response regulator transcription factor [Lachnospiraceae bacterium]